MKCCPNPSLVWQAHPPNTLTSSRKHWSGGLNFPLLSMNNSQVQRFLARYDRSNESSYQKDCHVTRVASKTNKLGIYLKQNAYPLPYMSLRIRQGKTYLMGALDSLTQVCPNVECACPKSAAPNLDLSSNLDVVSTKNPRCFCETIDISPNTRA